MGGEGVVVAVGGSTGRDSPIAEVFCAVAEKAGLTVARSFLPPPGPEGRAAGELLGPGFTLLSSDPSQATGFTATADAEAFMRNWYLPTGKLKIPAVTLHTTRDPVVQIFHEDSYAAAVEAAGGSVTVNG